jgi:hypothetical protein
MPAAFRRAYELGRVRFGMRAVWPLALFAGVVSWFVPWSAQAYAAWGLWLFALLLRVRGGRPGRTVEAAAKVAWIAPAMVLLVELVGGGCTEVPFEVVGAVSVAVLGACLYVARVAVQTKAGFAGWGSAAFLVAMTGGIGCACVGVGSLVGLGLVMALSAVLSLPPLLAQKRT